MHVPLILARLCLFFLFRPLLVLRLPSFVELALADFFWAFFVSALSRVSCRDEGYARKWRFLYCFVQKQGDGCVFGGD